MTSKENLDKLEKALIDNWCIGETLVDLSKCHISQETALKQIRDYTLVACNITYKDLDQIRKDLEVLEILKKKEIAIDELKNCIKHDSEDRPALEEYNDFAGDENSLTQEEYTLLKEWLKQ